jgi:hypothetical protein
LSTEEILTPINSGRERNGRRLQRMRHSGYFLGCELFLLNQEDSKPELWEQKWKWTSSPDPNLMSESETYAQENTETVEEDPAHVFTMEMGLEFVDFCLDYLEKDITSEDLDMELDLKDEVFAVSFHLNSMEHTYQYVSHRLLNRKLMTRMLQIWNLLKLKHQRLLLPDRCLI